jgi:glutamine synthetase
MGDLVQTHIIPAVVQYQNRLIQSTQGIMSVLGEKEGKAAAQAQIELIQKIATHLNRMKTTCDTMLQARKDANKIEHAEEKALAYCDKVRVHFDEIRYNADKLELLVDDELWPLPKFREMLFTR